MEGKTHRVGGVLCCLGGYALLEANGLLLGDVNPVLQLAVMYPFAVYGSVVSDLDHNWNSAPSKDLVSLGINRVLHLTSGIRERTRNDSFLVRLFDAKHRSWQTHSDVFLIALIGVAFYLISNPVGSADEVILRLISTGFILGVISHLVLDMLTPEGIWCGATTVISRVTKYKIIPRKISFVPNTRFFRTGGIWEQLVRKIMFFISLLIFLNILFGMMSVDVGSWLR